ncbi:phosphoribosylglycinamide formyltransferase [Candidatus Omnitrophota bacterium]
MNIAIFCSGNGSNFQAIVDACKNGLIRAKIAVMICDNPDAHAIKRAANESIRTVLVERKNFSSKAEFENIIIKELKKESIDLICLAGYMRMLSPEFVSRYRNRILNIHPALLPSFKGSHGIKDAIDYGAKVTGVTVHFVDEEMDAGPVILQESIELDDSDTEDVLAGKIHDIEHRIYPEAIRLFTEGKLRVAGRKVKILLTSLICLFILGLESQAMVGSGLVPLPVNTLGIDALPLAPIHLLHDGDYNEERSNVVIENQAKPVNQGPADKLGVFSFNIYENIEMPDQDESDLIILNKDKIEKPLTKKEIEEKKIKTSIKAARLLAEAMDSINADFAYKGMNYAIDTAKKVIDFREYMDEKYHLHLNASSDEALIKYKKKF